MSWSPNWEGLAERFDMKPKYGFDGYETTVMLSDAEAQSVRQLIMLYMAFKKEVVVKPPRKPTKREQKKMQKEAQEMLKVWEKIRV